MLKTKVRQQPQDKFEVEVYNKPINEFSEFKIKAGEKIKLNYQFDEVTVIIGGFSIKAGEEVMWTREENSMDHVQRNYEFVVNLEVLKAKKAKKAKKVIKSKKKK